MNFNISIFHAIGRLIRKHSPYINLGFSEIDCIYRPFIQIYLLKYIDIHIFPGNAFIVSVALADLLVSSVLIPTSVIVLLAGFDESSMAVCRVQWFFASCAFLVTILSLAVSKNRYIFAMKIKYNHFISIC